MVARLLAIQPRSLASHVTDVTGGEPRPPLVSPNPVTRAAAPSEELSEASGTMDRVNNGDRPAWAARLVREREARDWSQSQAVANLRSAYARRNPGKDAGSNESLLRQKPPTAPQKVLRHE